MRVLSLLALASLLLAGCASVEPEPVQDDPGNVDVVVDDTTGAIRGVVVDASISPIAEADVVAEGAGERFETKSNEEGIFVFNQLDPGVYFVTVSKDLHTESQTSVQVEAGLEDPPIVRVQIERLYDVDPFITQEKFKGFFQCAYSLLVSSTCVNDYSRICNPNTVPVCCPGGCFPELARTLDNREYVTELGENWGTVNIEMVWKPSVAGTSAEMGMTVSYKAREGASHWWSSNSGESPMITRLDCSALCTDKEEEFPDKIPRSGLPDLFTFMSAGSGNVALGQEFEIFHTTSYIAPLPEGWSFVNGDEPPF